MIFFRIICKTDYTIIYDITVYQRMVQCSLSYQMIVCCIMLYYIIRQYLISVLISQNIISQCTSILVLCCRIQENMIDQEANGAHPRDQRFWILLSQFLTLSALGIGAQLRNVHGGIEEFWSSSAKFPHFLNFSTLENSWSPVEKLPLRR